jgi:dihydrofolate reductase
VAHDVEEAVALAAGDRISVIGGAEIFEMFMPIAKAVELTEVQADIEGDTFMPPLDPAVWQEAAREEHAVEDGRPAFSFVRLERRSSSR